MLIKHGFGALLFCVSLLQGIDAAAQHMCGSVFEGGAKRADYNDSQYHRGRNGGASGLLANVERRHFTPKVESLAGGESSYLIDDLGYTLSVFPNHHRALLALVRYDRKLGGRLPQTNKPYPTTVECYMRRALEFRPNDGKTLQILGMYHHLNDRFEEAIKVYREAAKFTNSAELDYNMGLAYVEIEEFDKAREHARRAYDAGYPLPGLRNRLARNGVELN